MARRTFTREFKPEAVNLVPRAGGDHGAGRTGPLGLTRQCVTPVGPTPAADPQQALRADETGPLELEMPGRDVSLVSVFSGGFPRVVEVLIHEASGVS